MIEEAIIVNHKSHKYTHIYFSPTTNAIIGESNQGKSALLSALYKNLLNDTDGTFGNSHWNFRESKQGNKLFVEDSFVALKVDGKWITRLRNNDKNCYILDNDPETKSFKGYPDVVKNFLNFKPINVKTQADPSYLFFDKPTDSDEKINEVVNLGVMTETLSNAKAGVQKAKTDMAYKQKELNIAEEELKEYDGLDELVEEIYMLKQSNKKVEDEINRLAVLRDKVSEYKSINVSVRDIRKVDQDLKKVKELVKEHSDIKQKQIDINHLYSLYKEYTELTHKIKHSNVGELEKELHELSVNYEKNKKAKNEFDNTIKPLLVSYREASQDVERLSGITSHEKETKAVSARYSEIMKNAHELDILKEAFERYKGIIEKEKKLSVSLEQNTIMFHDNFPDVCPLCGIPQK